MKNQIQTNEISAEMIESLYADQLRSWPEFALAVERLKEIECRDVHVDERTIRLQWNPQREVNVVAPADPESVARRPCFLCRENRPAAQVDLPFDNDWLVVCNPFPLSDHHFVVLDTHHVPQVSLGKTLGAMLKFTGRTGYTTMYNGPRCGASAPDHLHFQAIPYGHLPLENQMICMGPLCKDGLYYDPRIPQRVYILGKSVQVYEELFEGFSRRLNLVTGEDPASDPNVNIVVMSCPGGHRGMPIVIVHPRGGHRPSCYFDSGERKFLISPGAADMAGLVIVPRRTDFDRLGGHIMRGIFEDVCLDPDIFARLVKGISV